MYLALLWYLLYFSDLEPNLKYLKGVPIHSYSNQTVWYWHKNRHIDQWNRNQSPEINSHIWRQQIFDKEAKNTKWEKDSLFSKEYWENWTATLKKKKKRKEINWIPILHYSQDLTQNRLGFNIRPKTLKFLGGNIGGNLPDIVLDNDFLDMTPKAEAIKDY